MDGISGREDTGGLDTLVNLIKEPTVPVIMAINKKSLKIMKLAKACKIVNLVQCPSPIAAVLDHVLQTEGGIETGQMTRYQ